MKLDYQYSFLRQPWHILPDLKTIRYGIAWSMIIGILFVLLLFIEPTISLPPSSFSFNCIPIILLSSVFLYTKNKTALPATALTTFSVHFPWSVEWWKWGSVAILFSLYMSINGHFLAYFKEIVSINQLNAYTYLFIFSMWISGTIFFLFNSDKQKYYFYLSLIIGIGLTWQFVNQPNFEGFVFAILLRDITWLVGLLLLSGIAFFASLLIRRMGYHQQKNITNSFYLLLISIIGLSGLYYILILIQNNTIIPTIELQKGVLGSFLYFLLLAFISIATGMYLLQRRAFFSFYSTVQPHVKKYPLFVKIWSLLIISFLCSSMLSNVIWQVICYAVSLLYVFSVNAILLSSLFFKDSTNHSATFNFYKGLSFVILLSSSYLLIELSFIYWATFVLLIIGSICIFLFFRTIKDMDNAISGDRSTTTYSNHYPNQSLTNYIYSSSSPTNSFKILVPLTHEKHIVPLMKLAIVIATVHKGEIIGLPIRNERSSINRQYHTTTVEDYTTTSTQQKYLQLAQDQAHKANLPFIGVVKAGLPTAHDILQIAKEYRCKLTILNWKDVNQQLNQHMNKLSGRVIDNLLQNSQNDVLLVKWGQQIGFKKLLLPYLSSLYDHQRLAEQYGATLAKGFDGRLLTCNIRHNQKVKKAILEQELVQISERLHQENGLEAYCKTIEHSSQLMGILEAAEDCDTIILEAPTSTALPATTTLGQIRDEIIQQSDKTIVVLKRAKTWS